MAPQIDARQDAGKRALPWLWTRGQKARGGENKLTARFYPVWFYLPAGIVYSVLFLIPAFSAFYFSLTRWTIFEVELIGLANYESFLREPFLLQGLTNTLIFAAVTVALSVTLGLLVALLLTTKILGQGFLRSVMFFPVLVSTVGVGITFTVLMHPTEGLINETLSVFGVEGPGWLTQPGLVLVSVALVTVWKGVGAAALIYIAGIAAVPREYLEAASVDGAGALGRIRHVILPLIRPSTTAVLILSLIGGLRSFDMIWVMTKGGPGFSSDVVGSVIYKQYQSGFYGLSTAGNVILFLLVIAIVGPLSWYLNRKEVEL